MVFDLVKTFGSGVPVNLLSNELIQKLDAFQDKEAVKAFLQTLQDWQIEFDQQHDGTVVTTGHFAAYIKHYNVIEHIVCYILEPSSEAIPEKTFLDNLHVQISDYLFNNTGKVLSPSDSALIEEFLSGILMMFKEFLIERIPLKNRGLFYLLCQNNLKLNELEVVLKDHFQMQEQTISALLNQLSSISTASEAEARVKEKIYSWNTRQIKSLGDRYTPKLNIPLDLTNVLQGASIDRRFKSTFLENVDQFLISIGRTEIKEVQEKCDEIRKLVIALDFFNITANDIDSLATLVDDIQNLLAQRIDEYHKTEESQALNSAVYQLYQKQIIADEFSDYLTSEPVQAAISPYIVLVGDGGTGKSHLIADFIEGQEAIQQVSLLLLGQQIPASMDLISNLPNLLGCDITYHELFDTLESIACGQGSRVLICIDALNEGAGVSFWNHTLPGLVEFLKEYLHLGLLVSIRTQYEKTLLERQDLLYSNMLHIEHNGFSSVSYEAMHQYFSFYGITTDSVVFPDTEFSNPLFLSLFCKSHQNMHICLENLSLPSVYAQYIDFEESQLAAKCGYNKAYKLVTKIIRAMVKQRVSEQTTAVQLPVETAIELFVEISKQWNITSDIYSALLSEGILTQSIGYDNNEYVYITYERLEDFFLAEKIAEAYSELPQEQFLEKYSWVLNRSDIFQFLGIILAENRNCELSAAFPSNTAWDAARIRSAFLYGLRWRKDSSFTADTIKYIDQEILNYENSFNQFIDVLFALSARSNHPLNAQNSFRFFQQYSMPDRDEEFIPLFDELYDDSDSALSHLIDWGLNYSRTQNIPDSVAANSATILCWLLISPNNTLRDRATKAITCILVSHMEALISVLKRFDGIDDPYIAERLFGAAFGCVVHEQSPEHIRELAIYVYSTIFDKDEVYPNILLRTYAKNIIDYANHIGCIDGCDFDVEKVTPPYNSQFPQVPSDDEIKGYRLDYRSKTFQNHHWAQNEILDSMKVEYSRDGQPGGYGDFGRYTFQAYFSSWKQLHPMDLKNIAIKRIFDLGYDVEKHGHYDRNCTNHVGIGTQTGKRERIGKKYQWIVLYELAAQVSDHYQMAVDDDFMHSLQEYCKGSFYPNIRNIDPTVLPIHTTDKICSTGSRVLYTIPDNSYDEWLKDFAVVPSLEQCMTLQYQGQSYLLLTGNYNWTEPKQLGVRAYDIPQKNMWYQIRGYTVKNEHADRFLQALATVDLMQCRMPELHSNSTIYNKEYFWSDADSFFKNPYYGYVDWETIDDALPLFHEKVLIPVRQYFSERRGDINSWGTEATSLYWYKPCEELCSKLQLQYATNSNSLFVDDTGNPICFDSSELLHEESGFYIRQDKLSEFLDACGYTMVWTSLGEKRVLRSMFRKWKLPPKAIHRCSVYCLRDNKLVRVSETIWEDKLYG